jgi:hypothetical protein
MIANNFNGEDIRALFAKMHHAEIRLFKQRANRYYALISNNLRLSIERHSFTFYTHDYMANWIPQCRILQSSIVKFIESFTDRLSLIQWDAAVSDIIGGFMTPLVEIVKKKYYTYCSVDASSACIFQPHGTTLMKYNHFPIVEVSYTDRKNLLDDPPDQYLATYDFADPTFDPMTLVTETAALLKQTLAEEMNPFRSLSLGRDDLH